MSASKQILPKQSGTLLLFSLLLSPTLNKTIADLESSEDLTFGFGPLDGDCSWTQADAGCFEPVFGRSRN